MHPRRRLWLKAHTNAEEAAVAVAAPVVKEAPAPEPVVEEAPVEIPVVEEVAPADLEPMKSKKVAPKAAAAPKRRVKKASPKEHKK